MYRIFHATAPRQPAHSLVMLRASVVVSLVSVISVAGCKKDYPQCDHYVDLSVKCDSDVKSLSEDERDTARMMLGGMCSEAFRNDTSAVSGEAKEIVVAMYRGMRKRASCAVKANTCEEYSRCETETD